MEYRSLRDQPINIVIDGIDLVSFLVDSFRDVEGSKNGHHSYPHYRCGSFKVRQSTCRTAVARVQRSQMLTRFKRKVHSRANTSPKPESCFWLAYSSVEEAFGLET